jgi:hypothetical protein
LIDTPADSSAWNQADFVVAKSRRGSVTSITTSGDGWAATARSASPPSLPGLPDGMRNSTILRSPNSDIDCWASMTWPHWKPRSATSTSRSEKPASRAARRRRSTASSTSRCSSP